jgi:hypothetical protein
MTDRSMVERAQAGDRDAYERSALESADRLYGVAYRIARDLDRAQDAVQQTPGAERTLTAAGNEAEHPNWSPDGQWIVYDVAAWMPSGLAFDQLERIAADGTGEPEILVAGTPEAGSGLKPWYLPDGSSILYGCRGPGAMAPHASWTRDGSDQRILVDEPGAHENHFSWGVAAP